MYKFKGFTYDKDEAGNRRRKHHLIWEKAYGPIPKGHLVIFADGNRDNFSLENLILISRSKFQSSRPSAVRVPLGSKQFVRGVCYIKVSDQPGRWRPKHLLIWEATYGPIPKGHYVKFADGDKSNFRLDNLILVSYSQVTKWFNQSKKEPIGTEKFIRDAYFIKVSDRPDGWQRKHRLIWEVTHGPIPKGYEVIFADGDKSNFRLNNLVLISVRERCYLQFKKLLAEPFIELPTDMKGDFMKALIPVAKLTLATNDRRNKKGKEKL